MNEWPGNPPDWWLRYHGHASSRSDAGSDAGNGSAEQMVEITGEVKIQTGKAIQFYDGSRTVWLPRSQIEIADDGAVWCAEWLAKKNGLI